MLNLKCKNCKNRWTWDCEDYHWGYFDIDICKDFLITNLDIETLDDEQKENFKELIGVLRGINEKNYI